MEVSGVNGGSNLPQKPENSVQDEKENKEFSIFDSKEKDGSISAEEQMNALKEAAENNNTIKEAVKRGFNLDLCLSMFGEHFEKVLTPLKNKIKEFDEAFKAKIDAFVNQIAKMASKMTGAEYTERTEYGNYVTYTTTRDGQVVHREEMTKNGQQNVVSDYDGENSKVVEYKTDDSLRNIVETRVTETNGNKSVTKYYGEKNVFLGSEETNNEERDGGAYVYTTVKKDADGNIVEKEIKYGTPLKLIVNIDGENQELTGYVVETEKYDSEGHIVSRIEETPLPEFDENGQMKTVERDLLENPRIRLRKIDE